LSVFLHVLFYASEVNDSFPRNFVMSSMFAARHCGARCVGLCTSTTHQLVEHRALPCDLHAYLEAGWISERIRGDKDIMSKHRSAGDRSQDTRAASRRGGAGRIGEVLGERCRWSLTCTGLPSLRQRSAEQFVRRSRHTYTSFEEFMELATYIYDGAQWAVEGDMQLSELLHVCANHQGVDPQNASATALIEVLETLQVIRTRRKAVCPF
jgi:hypothetical protein